MYSSLYSSATPPPTGDIISPLPVHIKPSINTSPLSLGPGQPALVAAGIRLNGSASLALSVPFRSTGHGFPENDCAYGLLCAARAKTLRVSVSTGRVDVSRRGVEGVCVRLPLFYILA